MVSTSMSANVKAAKSPQPVGNYDGKQKNPTTIGDDVKIGSSTMLVAPVTVGRGAVSGAGSVITKDVPEDSLVAGVPAQVKKKLR